MGWVMVSKQNQMSKQRSRYAHKIGLCLVVFGLFGLAGCSSGLNKYGVKTSKRVYASKGALPKKVGYYKVGKPYKVAGKWYYPREDKTYNKTGMASWYGDEFHGRKTANGEIFDMHAFTGAHKTLPLPSLVKVTNLANGKSIIVRVNDRGPYHGGRVIDMSRAAADALGFRNKGVTKVRVEYFGKAADHPNGDSAKIAALGGKPHTGGGSVQLAAKAKTKDDRNFFDHLFGWKKPKFVAESATLAAVTVAANAGKVGLPPAPNGRLTGTDMQEFDSDVAAAISSSGTQPLPMARAVSAVPKNQGRLLDLGNAKPVELVASGGDFTQVAMFSDIKQAVEYKRQLGNAIFSKIDISQQGSKTVYLVMVQA